MDRKNIDKEKYVKLSLTINHRLQFSCYKNFVFVIEIVWSHSENFLAPLKRRSQKYLFHPFDRQTSDGRDMFSDHFNYLF